MPSRHQPIQFSGDVRALAATLRMPIDDVIAALDELIARGHLEQIGGTTWLLQPARRRLGTTTVIAPARVDMSRLSALTG
jgi:hypothetical protein